MRFGEASLVYAKLGAKIASARNRKGWSQSVLARKAQLTRGSVANIELGRQRAPLDTIWRIGKALGIEPRLLVPNLSELLEVPESAENNLLPPRVKDYLSRLSGGESKVKALIREATVELGAARTQTKEAQVEKKTEPD